eukprot:5350654-Heterocapsa_arctica.AAC.1
MLPEKIDEQDSESSTTAARTAGCEGRSRVSPYGPITPCGCEMFAQGGEGGAAGVEKERQLEMYGRDPEL